MTKEQTNSWELNNNGTYDDYIKTQVWWIKKANSEEESCEWLKKVISQEKEKWEAEKAKEIEKLKEEWEESNYW